MSSSQQNQAPVNKVSIIIDLTIDDNDSNPRAPTPHSQLLSKLSSPSLTWLNGTHPFSSSTSFAPTNHNHPQPPPTWDSDIRRTLLSTLHTSTTTNTTTTTTANNTTTTPLCNSTTTKKNVQIKKTSQKEDCEEVMKVMREVRDLMVITMDEMLKTKTVMDGVLEVMKTKKKTGSGEGDDDDDDDHDRTISLRSGGSDRMGEERRKKKKR